MRIQNNNSANNALRQYSSNNTTLGKNLEKLSSGYRINRAGDDAAGLAISEKMRSQITGLEKATDNANDGISLVQTAEGALTEVHSMLNRMTELATQSANGTFDDKTDRASLQEEVDSLVSEIDRISESTNYNGINLLDGSLAGGGANGTALTGAKVVNFKAAAVSVTGADMSTFSFAGAGAVESINIDGANISVDWSKLSTDDQSALKKDWNTAATGASKADAEKAASIMEKAINDAIDASGLDVQHITVTADGGDTAADKFKFTSGSVDKNSSITFDGNSGYGDTLTATGTAVATESITNATDMKGKFVMSIDGKDFTIDTTAATNTTSANLASGLKTAIDATITLYNNAVPADQALKADDFRVDVTKDGRIEITNNSSVKIGFSDIEGGEAAKAMGISTEGKLAGSGLSLQVGDTADDFNKVTVSVGNMNASSLGISNVNISKQDGAQKAVDKIKDAINTVSGTRGKLGAIQNRLEHTINNLSVASENITEAESRIRDVDMAKEMTQYTQNNILSQASQAMLAQANQLPQGVLQLLQ